MTKNEKNINKTFFSFAIYIVIPAILLITTILISRDLGFYSNGFKIIAEKKTPDISFSESDVVILLKKKYRLLVENLPAKSKVKWLSSDETVASVSTRGLVSGKGAGKAVVTAVVTLVQGDIKKLKAVVLVKKPPVTAVKFTQTQLTLLVGKKKQLSAKAYPTYADNTNVTYSVSNSKVANITKAGMLTAVMAGSTTITVSSNNGKKAYCKLVVRQKKEMPVVEMLTFTCDGDFVAGQAAANISAKLDKRAAEVVIDIYAENGEVVRTITPKMQGNNMAEATWDGRDKKGNIAAAGAYRITILADGRRKTSAKLNFLAVNPFKGGNGSKENPYLITSEEDLNRIRDFNGRFFKQTADIKLKAQNFEPLFSSKKKFNGIYDGAGYAITGLKILRIGMSDSALFAGIAKEGTVKNLNIGKCLITGGDYTGGIAGKNYGTIRNCSVSGIIHGERYVAGVCGYNKGSVRKCISLAVITGKKTGNIVIDIFSLL